MRKWTAFLDLQAELKVLLGDGHAYAPATAAEVAPETLIPLLSGQGQDVSANAVVAWAKMLEDEEHNYYDQLLGLVDEIKDRAKARGVKLGELTEDAELMIIVVCLLGFDKGPPKKWGEPKLDKWQGMGYALGSEFLRNLGWRGFKPDTHIIRLLKKWVPEVVEAQRERAVQLVALMGRSSKELIKMAQFSLAGMAITPDGMSYSKADNLLWLLGSEVIPKDRETTAQREIYFIEA